MKKNILFFLGLAIFSLAFFIRLSNLFTFNSWWADDGGAHIGYIQTIAEAGRLPTPEENYLAWHEPGYYALMAPVWNVAKSVGRDPQDWLVAIQIVLFAGVLFLAYRLAKQIIPEKKFVHYAVVFALAFQFTGVKLSAFVTNELLAQFWILLLLSLALRWKLLETFQKRELFYWATLVGIGMWIKLTIILPVLIVGLLWLVRLVKEKQTWTIPAVLIVGVIITVLYSPWLYHKSQTIGSVLTINNYEHSNQQSLLSSNGWNHLWNLNPSPYTTAPYWMGEREHSFWSMLSAETMGDYYFLFGHVDSHNVLTSETVEVGSGRLVSLKQFHRASIANRVGLGLLLFWVVGFLGFLWTKRNSLITDFRLQITALAPVAALSALIYNLLRFPYLERGIVKFHFVYFGLIFLLIGSFLFWSEVIKNKWILWALVYGSLAVYVSTSWRVLVVTPAFY